MPTPHEFTLGPADNKVGHPRDSKNFIAVGQLGDPGMATASLGALHHRVGPSNAVPWSGVWGMGGEFSHPDSSEVFSRFRNLFKGIDGTFFALRLLEPKAFWSSSGGSLNYTGHKRLIRSLAAWVDDQKNSQVLYYVADV